MATSQWVSIVGGTDTGADVEAKLDNAFANIDTEIDKVVGIEADIAALSTAISVVSPSALPEQTLVANTPEKLEWMTSGLVNQGNGSLSYTLLTHSILISTTGIYKMFGVIDCTAANNDLVTIELYVNGSPTGFKSSLYGKGSATMTFVYNFMTSFAANDDITLYVTSSGTAITVQNASVTVEKTPY